MSTFSFDFQPDYCGVIDRHNCGRVLPARFQVKPCWSAKLCCSGVASSRSASNSWTIDRVGLADQPKTTDSAGQQTGEIADYRAGSQHARSPKSDR
jgi:hypothetical protein